MLDFNSGSALDAEAISRAQPPRQWDAAFRLCEDLRLSTRWRRRDPTVYQQHRSLHRDRYWLGLPKAPNHKTVAIRAVEAKHVDSRLSTVRENYLLNSKDRVTRRNCHEFRSLRIGGCRIDCLVRVCHSYVIFAS